MFNKALFKQSCKANGIMWAIITFAVCFMLACVMLISGNGNVGEMRNGITNSIVESVMDSQIQERAVGYYNYVDTALTKFDTAFMTYLTSPEAGDTNPQNTAVLKGVEAINTWLNEEKLSDNLEVKGVVFATLNLDADGDGTGDFDYFYSDSKISGKVLPYTTTLTPSALASPTREADRKKYSENYSSAFLAYNFISDENTEKVLEALQKYSIEKDDYENLTYNNNGTNEARYVGESGYKFIKTLSLNNIVTYQARLDSVTEQVNADDTVPAENKQSVIMAEQQKIVNELGKSFLSALPTDVSNSLEELGSMNLFGMIVGSIYFKMAGLLLPIIYIIMVSNNLIAGQVDRGSMAYILSTSTKRDEVTFTQAVFLILSLFVMCLLVMLTSFVCLAIVSTKISITYGQLALLSLGAFMTLFAMSGISFLASCWFNRSKYSTSLGGGLNMFFLVATMLGLFGSNVLPSVVRLDALNFFNYCSIITLFDEISILNSTTTFIWKFAILLGIGTICYVVGAIKFKKKDLPL